MNAYLKKMAAGLAALTVAGFLWLPCLHWLFTRPVSAFYVQEGVSPRARALAARHLELWSDPQLRQQELNRMRVSNAEWDFMGRSYLVWSLANLGLRDPAMKPACLQTMDRIIAETLQLEKEKGMTFFLMPYAKDRPYVVQPARSLFLDGEIALMLASRRVLEEKPEYQPLLTERVYLIVQGWRRSPHLALESYPDECWTFDHVVALAALRTTDYLDGTDHSALIRDWVAMARKKLVDPVFRPAGVQLQRGRHAANRAGRLQPLDGGPRPAMGGRGFRPRPVQPHPPGTGPDHAGVQLRPRMAGFLERPAGH